MTHDSLEELQIGSDSSQPSPSICELNCLVASVFTYAFLLQSRVCFVNKLMWKMRV